MTLTSLVEALGAVELHIYIADVGLSRGDRQVLTDIDACVEFVYLSKRQQDSLVGLHRGRFASWTPYCRIHIAEVLPAEVDRVLYLDADLLVLESVDLLWHKDLHGLTVGAVRDTWIRPEHAETIVGADPSQPAGHGAYFNSGVLLIDLARWREERVGERTLDFLQRSPGLRFHDQDALNAVLAGRWRELDARWNVYVQGPEKKPRANTVAALTAAVKLEGTPGILHFVGSRKPWVDNSYLEPGMRKLYADCLARFPGRA